MKSYLERATGVTQRNIDRCVKDIGGKLVRTKNHQMTGIPLRCAYNSFKLAASMPDSTVVFGYRIYPNNGDSTDPNRTMLKAHGQVCFEAHYVVRDAAGVYWCSTPADLVVDGYEFWFVAVSDVNDPSEATDFTNKVYQNGLGWVGSGYTLA